MFHPTCDSSEVCWCLGHLEGWTKAVLLKVKKKVRKFTGLFWFFRQKVAKLRITKPLHLPEFWKWLVYNSNFVYNLSNCVIPNKALKCSTGLRFKVKATLSFGPKKFVLGIANKKSGKESWENVVFSSPEWVLFFSIDNSWKSRLFLACFGSLAGIASIDKKVVFCGESLHNQKTAFVQP